MAPTTRRTLNTVRDTLVLLDRYLATQVPGEVAAGPRTPVSALVEGPLLTWGQLHTHVTTAIKLLTPPVRRAPPIR